MGSRRRRSSAAVAEHPTSSPRTSGTGKSPHSSCSNNNDQKKSDRHGHNRRRHRRGQGSRRTRQRGTTPDRRHDRARSDHDSIGKDSSSSTSGAPDPIIDVHFRVNVGQVPSCEEAMLHLNSTAPSGWSVQKVSYDANSHLFTASVMITNAQEWDSISMRDRRIHFDNIVLQPFMRCAGCNKLGKDMLLCGACKSVTYCGEDCQKGHWIHAHREQCQKAARESTAKCYDCSDYLDRLIATDPATPSSTTEGNQNESQLAGPVETDTSSDGRDRYNCTNDAGGVPLYPSICEQNDQIIAPPPTIMEKVEEDESRDGGTCVSHPSSVNSDDSLECLAR